VNRSVDKSKQIDYLPDSISHLTKLRVLFVDLNNIENLPESIVKLTKLEHLDVSMNSLKNLPENINLMASLSNLELECNDLTRLPDLIGEMPNLKEISLSVNFVTDLSPLQVLSGKLDVHCLGVHLPPRYWTKFSEWKSEWLLDEENAEIRKVIIEQIGYDRICQELDAIERDIWREYTLLEIKGEIDVEPIVLLKMTCPSTGHIHALRVPPDMQSAAEAITWVNGGIHPDDIAIAT
jgi:leucine-rich repeat protein SHOC2